MTTEANDGMLDRSVDPKIRQILVAYASYLEEAVNFGTHLVLWKGEEPELLVTKLMLRYFLEILDALSILIKSGSAEAGKSLIRSLFEINMYVDFIYQNHTANRAAAFLILIKYDQLKELEKMHHQTDRGKATKSSFQQENVIKDFVKTIDLQIVEKQLKDIEGYLKLPENKIAVDEYERMKLVRKNFQWYTLFEGATTLEGLARLLGKYTFYEILYRKWSKTVHGIDIIKEKLVQISDDEAYMRRIRQPENLAWISKMACNFAINTFSHFVQGSFPGRYTEYKVWEVRFIASYEIGLGHEYISFLP